MHTVIVVYYRQHCDEAQICHYFVCSEADFEVFRPEG